MEGSKDIEPTKLLSLASFNSDGWGDYSLNLARDMISQYREDAIFPADYFEYSLSVNSGGKSSLVRRRITCNGRDS